MVYLEQASRHRPTDLWRQVPGHQPTQAQALQETLQVQAPLLEQALLLEQAPLLEQALERLPEQVRELAPQESGLRPASPELELVPASPLALAQPKPPALALA